MPPAPAASPPTPSPRLRDPERLQVLAATGLLAAAAPPGLGRLVELAADLTDAPLAFASLLGGERQLVAAATGTHAALRVGCEAEVGSSFCQFVVEADGPVVVDDARGHPLVARGARADRFGLGSYLGVPLRGPAGHVLGALCVGAPGPRAWSEADVRRLERLAALAADQLVLHAEVEARTRAQDALARSRGEYRRLADQAPDIIARFDRDARHLFVNAAVERATGLPAAALVGRTNEELGMPADLCARWRALVERVFATGEPARDSFEFTTPAGPRCFEAALVPERDGGAVTSVLAVTRDVTDERRAAALAREVEAQRRAEAALAAERARLAQIVATQQAVATAGLDTDRVLALMVERARELTGAESAVVELVEGEELVYRAASGRAVAFVGLRLRADRSLSGLSVRSTTLLRCDDSEGDPRVDAEACRRIGWRSMVVAPLEHDGRTVGVLKVAAPEPAAFDERHEATLQLLAGLAGTALANAAQYEATEALVRALEASEARFRGILETVRAPAVCLDTLGRVTFANDAFLALTGWGRDETLGGDYFARCVPDADAARDVFRATVAAGRADELPAHYENEVLTRAGGRRIVAWDNTVLRDGRGAVAGTASVGHDVTERVRAQRLKDQLIATASHELRTPLTAIRGALDLLEGLRAAPASDTAAAARGPRERVLLDMARRHVERLTRLVNDVLDVDRLDAGRAPLRRAPADVAALLGAARDGVAGLADEAGVRLDVLADETAPPVDADADRVVQVLTNLVANALKFSPTGTAVTLSAAPEPGDAGWVRVTVRDQGRGIPADRVEAVFERFVQVEAADAREKGGAGLGLAICRAIVTQHGGRIWAESEGAGRGSAFHFTLPAA